jgi:Terpene cyclase DEP1
MNLRIRYLILCIAGFVLPCSQFMPWVLAHDLDERLFVHKLFSNKIGGVFVRMSSYRLLF